MPVPPDLRIPKPGRDRVREAEPRLTAIVHSAMDAIITIDADERIVLFNAAAEQMFGCDAAQVIGARLERFIPERFRATHHAHVQRFIATSETSRRMGQQRPLWGLRADGIEFPIEASISQATVGGKQLLTVIVRDISERLKTEQALRAAIEQRAEGEARLAAIVESAMDAIIAIDETQSVVLFNAAAEAMFGCLAAQAVGGPVDRFIPERFRDAHRAHVKRFSQTGATSRRMGMQTAIAGVRSNGAEFPIEASISQARGAGRKLMTVILRDITERVNYEGQLRSVHDELRQVAVAMQQVRESERTRIARELHDELGQALTALKLDVSLIETMILPEQHEALERTVEMRRMLDLTIATTRRISADLRPLVLDDLGLSAAAEWLMQNVVQRAGLAFELDVDPECDRLGEPYASSLFRIMQESLTNVVRHARASRVAVRLELSGGVATLTVADDGIGIIRDVRPKPDSFGLRGIQERVLLLGGEVSFASPGGAGVTLVAEVPIASGRGTLGASAT